MAMQNKDRADGRRDALVDAAHVSYVPATPGNWTEGDPGTVADALDEARETGGTALDAHIADSTDPHGSTLSQSVAINSPAHKNNSGDLLLSAAGSININALNAASDTTVAIQNGLAGKVANVTVDGTVNGRDVAADGTKLDNLAHETHYTLLAVGSGVSF